jgi:lipopolysaccharide transport system permease protein
MNKVLVKAGQAGSQYWSDLWHFRELLYFLAWRDIIVRYKQAVFGVAWAIVRPLLTLLIFTFIFSRVGRIPTYGLPYSIVAFAGIWPWQFFASALSESSNSLVNNATLVSKIYFPRLLVPIGSLTVAFVDFLLSGAIFFVLIVYHHIEPTWRMAMLPLFFLMAFATASGAGILLSALNVKYRDVRMIVPFITQFGFFLSPVIFVPESVIPAKWMTLYYANPMVAVIQGFRWCITGRDEFGMYWPGFFMSLTTLVVVFFIGIRYFRRTEKTLADVI